MNKSPKEKKQTTPITVYLNEDEAYMVQKWKQYTHSKSASQFLRKMLYLTGCCGVRIRVENPELSQISDELHLFNLYVATAIEEMLKHDEIDMDDIEAIRQKMDALYNIVEKCYRVILAERRVQRKNVERYLVDWADNLLGLTKGR